MFNAKMMVGMLSGQLKKFLKENIDGSWSIGLVYLNTWLEENKHPFEVSFDEEKKILSVRLTDTKKE